MDLSDIKNKEEAKRKIDYETKKDELNVILGWNDSYYSFSKNELERYPPLIICNISLHGFLYNEKAIQIIEDDHGDSALLKRSSDPEWMEKNLPAITKLLLKIKGLDEKRLESFYEYLSEKGIWKVEDMHLHHESFLEIFEKLKLLERTDFWVNIDTFKNMSKKNKDKIKGIKVFTDGALGPQTAAIGTNYTDNEDGFLLYDKSKLEDLIREIQKERISIHAIGDRAIEQVITSLEELEKEGFSQPEIRIEHAQFIDKKMAEKAKTLGITLSMQPNFSLDSQHYSDRLSKKYLEMNNPFRMLIDEVGFVPGEDIIFGSDGMPHGARAALEASLYPPYENQRLTLQEFQEGYCIEDHSLGQIDFSRNDSKERILVENISF